MAVIDLITQGIMKTNFKPEELPPSMDIKKLEWRLKSGENMAHATTQRRNERL